MIIKLSRSMHRQVAMLAKRDGVSLNDFIVSSICMHFGREDMADKLISRITAPPSEQDFWDVVVTTEPTESGRDFYPASPGETG